MLEKMLTGDDKKAAEIVDFKENHMETTVSFTITAKQEKIDEFENGNGGLMKKFKLTGSLSTSNMTVFSEGKLTRFANPEDILRSFYQVRYQLYEKRKARMVENLRTEQRKLSNKARFVEEVCTADLVVSNRKRVEILHELQERGYDTFLIKDTAGNDVSEDEEVNEDEEVSTAELAKGYEYLLGMKIWSLTFEKAQKLRAERDAKTEELEILEAMTPSDIWVTDLDAIEIALEDRDAALLAMAIDDKKAQSKSKKIQAKAAKKSKKKKKDDWDSDEDSDVVMSDSEEDEVKSKATTSRAKAVAKKPAAKPVPKLSTKKSTAVVLDEVLILSDSEDQGVATIKSKSNKTAKTAPLPKRAPKHASASSGTKSVKTATKKTVVPPEEEDDDVMMGLSLSDRMKKRLGQSSDDSPKSSGSAKSSFDGCESMDSLVAESFAHASLTPAVKKTAPGKKKVAATKMTAPKAKAVANKRAPQKKASVLEESDSEDEFDFHSDEEAVTKAAAPAAGPRSRRVNTTAKKTYAFSDSDEASDSDF
jgi:DNA topoisomerase-2